MESELLLADKYAPNVCQTWFQDKKHLETATYEMFFRKTPPDCAYLIFTGLQDVLQYLSTLWYKPYEIEYLRSLGYSESFLDYLQHEFKFTGEVWSVPEGTPVFAGEPCIRITAPRIQARMIEAALLYAVNYPTYVATKSERICRAAATLKGGIVAKQGGTVQVMDFGLRRSPDPMRSTRAAFIGGCSSTSNLKAAREYNIPCAGTMDHSFVMSYETQIEAFRAYAKINPDNTITLPDTYNPYWGIDDSIIVGKELQSQGHVLKGTRHDSGDLIALAWYTRAHFDAAGLTQSQVGVSGDVDEYKILQMEEAGAPIDFIGVGSRMVNPGYEMTGVYKLVEDVHGPQIKIAEGKLSLPDKKQIYRLHNGVWNADVIALASETPPEALAPILEQNPSLQGINMLSKVMENGKIIEGKLPGLDRIQRFVRSQVAAFPFDMQQLIDPQVGEFYVSEKLKNLTEKMQSIKTFRAEA